MHVTRLIEDLRMKKAGGFMRIAPPYLILWRVGIPTVYMRVSGMLHLRSTSLRETCQPPALHSGQVACPAYCAMFGTLLSGAIRMSVMWG